MENIIYQCPFCLKQDQSIDVITDHINQVHTESALEEESGSGRETDIPVTTGVQTKNIDGNSLADATENGIKQFWSQEATKLLLRLYQEHKEKFRSSKFTNKAVWKIISGKMLEMGHDFNYEQCDNKLKNLKKTYKTIMDNDGASGRGAMRWQYFDIMQEIFFHSPEVTPVSLASSTEGFVSLKRPASSSAPSLSSNGSVPPPENSPDGPSHSKQKAFPLKRAKKTEDEPAWVKTMREDQERRHNERMQVANNLIEVLKSFAPKQPPVP